MNNSYNCIVFSFLFCVCASFLLTTNGHYHEGFVVFAGNIGGNRYTNAKGVVFWPDNTSYPAYHTPSENFGGDSIVEETARSAKQMTFELPLSGNGAYGLDLIFVHDKSTRCMNVRLNEQHIGMENLRLVADRYSHTVTSKFVRFFVAHQNLLIFEHVVSSMMNDKLFLNLHGLHGTESTLSGMVLIKYNNVSSVTHNINTNTLVGSTFHLLMKKLDDLQAEMKKMRRISALE
jgi:hypothetical protein